jgi:hypothetical protein
MVVETRCHCTMSKRYFVSLQMPMHALRNVSYTNIKVSKKITERPEQRKLIRK